MSETPSLPVPGPLPEHAVLEKDVGTWDAQVTFRFPGAEAHVSHGTMTSRLIAGGKWLVSDFRNDSTDFEGHGVYGYDPQKRKYVGSWVDTAGPSLHSMEGDWDPERRVMTMMVETTTPDGRPFRMRQVTECPSPTRQTFRSFVPMPGAGEHEIMTVTYTRR